MTDKNKQMEDRIKGALYGVAVGDALGGPLEFMTQAEITRRYGGEVRDMVGGGWLSLRPGETTDDTAMTLAVAEGIAENPENPIPGIGRRFIDWYISKPKDVGLTCARVITLADANCVETEAGWFKYSEVVDRAMNGRTGGNGALMRTVYVGLYYADDETREDMADRIASMTHWSDEAGEDCRTYATLVSEALTDPEKVKRVITELWSDEHAEPTGYTRDSMTCALNAIATTDNLEDAIVKAVNRGGDADTIGAITGGLAGAIYGYKQIPMKWKYRLNVEERVALAELANKAMKARMKGE